MLESPTSPHPDRGRDDRDDRDVATESTTPRCLVGRGGDDPQCDRRGVRPRPKGASRMTLPPAVGRSRTPVGLAGSLAGSSGALTLTPRTIVASGIVRSSTAARAGALAYHRPAVPAQASRSPPSRRQRRLPRAADGRDRDLRPSALSGAPGGAAELRISIFVNSSGASCSVPSRGRLMSSSSAIDCSAGGVRVPSARRSSSVRSPTAEAATCCTASR